MNSYVIGQLADIRRDELIAEAANEHRDLGNLDAQIDLSVKVGLKITGLITKGSWGTHGPAS